MEQQRRDAEGGATLLEAFAPERDFFFASGRGTLRASSCAAALPASVDDGLVEAAERVLERVRARAPGALVAGALPFDGREPASLGLYLRPESASALPEQLPRHLVGPPPAPRSARTIHMQPQPAGYAAAVASALARMGHSPLRKVVLSRALDLGLAEPLDVARLLSRLAAQNPGKFVFHARLEAAGRGARALVGASPELLVEKRGDLVCSHPLAGSRPRSADAGEDRRRADELEGCVKSRREHALVVDAVASTLAPYCSELQVPPAPALVSTPAMWHLGTHITGRLRDPDVSSLALAAALHPTPAVCGVPTLLARAAIRELEGYPRDFYAGAVGYSDAQGDGEWTVSIRCAEVAHASLRLYAGAGIVVGSLPEAELEETTAKLHTMLRALDVAPLAQVSP